jgi:hypothetical protein
VGIVSYALSNKRKYIEAVVYWIEWDDYYVLPFLKNILHCFVLVYVSPENFYFTVRRTLIAHSCFWYSLSALYYPFLISPMSKLNGKVSELWKIIR